MWKKLKMVMYERKMKEKRKLGDIINKENIKRWKVNIKEIVRNDIKEKRKLGNKIIKENIRWKEKKI